ncbi:cysteine methyltransferase [Pedobacter ginsengisoli]|uniref:Cysteine methyltransferase n=1 Tax=Pedobacter ginsengisoli TaxID=363852 RepID=A0A2D1U194_9SPHI|nr:MGMT family protein [Pedobacter ginsengisoli]ATP55359.1 cysteine methyltransferase [Pedobacter ginsengisoli]
MKPETYSFIMQVFDLARLIPEGRVTTYGTIARALGSAKSARLVGKAMNHSHGTIYKVPAHRVVNGSGLLTGKFHLTDPDQMQSLLEAEGITVKDNQVQYFKKVFCPP